MIEIKSFGSSSKGNAYHITDGITPILLECGINYKEIQKGLNFQMSSIKGVLLSHEHNDHAKAAKDVLKAGIPIYSSKGTFDALKIKNHNAKEIVAGKPFQLGTWMIRPFEVNHDVADPYGFLLANQAGDKLLFATDTYYIKYKFPGLTHILVEANYSLDILKENIFNGIVPVAMKKRLMRSHFSLENVKDFLRANDLSKVQEIWLLHLSDTNSNAELFKKEIMELTGRLVFVP